MLMDAVIRGVWKIKLMGRTACAVEETIASFNGVVNLIGAGFIVDFPEPRKHDYHCRVCAGLKENLPKANKGHLVAAIELDRW